MLHTYWEIVQFPCYKKFNSENSQKTCTGNFRKKDFLVFKHMKIYLSYY